MFRDVKCFLIVPEWFNLSRCIVISHHWTLLFNVIHTSKRRFVYFMWQHNTTFYKIGKQCNHEQIMNLSGCVSPDLRSSISYGFGQTNMFACILKVWLFALLWLFNPSFRPNFGHSWSLCNLFNSDAGHFVSHIDKIASVCAQFKSSFYIC